jgi:hypothetical protein
MGMTQNNTLIHKKLDAYFKSQSSSEEKIFNQLALYIYAVQSKDSDLHIMAKLLELDDIIKLVNYYDGDQLNIPTKEEFWNSYLTAICFYYKVIKGMNWTEIKNFLNLPEKDKDMISAISLGYKINFIRDTITNDLKDILKQVKDQDYNELLARVKREVVADEN